MKISQRDVWFPCKRFWLCFTPLGREWIPPGVSGSNEGFWLTGIPRRFEIHFPPYSFMMALTPGSRWVTGRNGKFRWIELKRHPQ
jgi:hypothetical protein